MNELKQKVKKINQRNNPDLTTENLQQFDAESQGSQSLTSYVTKLQKQIQEEKTAREKLEASLTEMRKIIEQLSQPT